MGIMESFLLTTNIYSSQNSVNDSHDDILSSSSFLSCVTNDFDSLSAFWSFTFFDLGTENMNRGSKQI